jgi:hypothetical protein
MQGKGSRGGATCRPGGTSKPATRSPTASGVGETTTESRAFAVGDPWSGRMAFPLGYEFGDSVYSSRAVKRSSTSETAMG